MTLDEASAYLGVAKISLRRWTVNGQLKCVRVGPRCDRRFRKSDIDAYIRKNLTSERASKRKSAPKKRTR